MLGPYLDELNDERVVLTSKGTLAKWLQETAGDVMVNTPDGRLWTVELKTERKWTGNLFLETWSNRNLNVKADHAMYGSNPGWLAKLRADLLLYYFLDADILISLDLFELKRWAFGYLENSEHVAGNLYRCNGSGEQEFRERPQGVYRQANDTWGRLVPVRTLQTEMVLGSVRETRVRQREMELSA